MKPYTLPLGAKAPPFVLPGTDGKIHSLAEFSHHQTLVIFFTCNHCPYVTESNELTRQTAKRFESKGVFFVGINSNSELTYAEDSFENMVKEMKTHPYPWVYLHDKTQSIAQHYGALCTPHFYVFDKERKLVYTGRSVDSPRDHSKITSHDLDKALEEHTSGKSVSTPLTNPIGCNIKWEGKPAKWMPAEACSLV